MRQSGARAGQRRRRYLLPAGNGPCGLYCKFLTRTDKEMNNLFDIDSPLMQTLGRLADLMILNFLTMICCIPIFTAGAAFTALDYMCLKMVRNEENYLIRGYFKSFKENFKQATGIWLIILWVIAAVVGDILIMYYAAVEFPFIIRMAVLFVSIVTLCTSMYVFPMQAKFVNPVFKTIKNAFKASLLQFPRTLLMIGLFFVPVLALMYTNFLVPIVFLFGFAFHSYLSAMLYNKFFLRIEEAAVRNIVQEEKGAAEDERIFHDEMDPEIAAIHDDALK